MKTKIAILLVVSMLLMQIPIHVFAESSTPSSWFIGGVSNDLYRLRDVAYINGNFVASDSNGIKTSVDGLNWTTKYSAFGITASYISSNHYAIVTYNAHVITSKNTSDWKDSIADPDFKVNITALTYGNNQYVALGLDKNIDPTKRVLYSLTSSDGLSWKKHTTDMKDSKSIYSVVWANGLYAAVGEDGIIYTSKDGIKWTKQSSGTTYSLSCIKWVNHQFIAVGSNGTILTSPNGVQWTSQKSNVKTFLDNIIINGNQMDVVGDNGTRVISTDGVKWTASKIPVGMPVISLIKANGKYYAFTYMGLVLVSKDLLNWSALSYSNYTKPTRIAYGNNLYVAIGTGGILLTSRDGLSWLSQGIDSNISFYDVKYLNGKFIAVGNFLNTEGEWSYNYYLYSSSDGLKWSKQQVLIKENSLDKLVWCKDRFIFLGPTGFIASSVNSVEWDNIFTGSQVHELTDAIWAKDKFILIGSSEVSNSIFSSKDGIKWTINEIKPSPDSFWTRLVQAGSFYFAYSEVSAGVSKDGIKWEMVKAPNNGNLERVMFDGKQLVAVIDGKIMVTGDGVNWTEKTVNITNAPDYKFTSIQSLVSFNNHTIIRTYDSTTKKQAILSSSDLSSWKPLIPSQDFNLFTSFTLDKQYVLHVRNTATQTGAFLVTSDGEKWTEFLSPAFLGCKTLVWGANKFVGITDSGNWIVSNTATPDSRIKVTVNGKILHFEVDPVISDKRTLVPIREIFESLGLTMSWDAETKTVTGSSNQKSIKLVLNSTNATVDGKPGKLDVPAKSINGRTMVPIRFISESLGADVTWDNSSRTVIVSQN